MIVTITNMTDQEQNNPHFGVPYDISISKVRYFSEKLGSQYI